MSTQDLGETLVQTAKGWPGNAPGGWTSRPNVRPLRSSDGAGQVLGDAALEETYGQMNFKAAEDIYQYERLDAEGRYVRILEKAVNGALQLGEIEYNEHFYGFVDSTEIMPTAQPTVGAGTSMWQCTGMAGILDEAFVFDARELTDNPSPPSGALVNTLVGLPFNAIPGGDRSASVDQSVGAYVFDRSGGSEWTAQQAIEYLLALYANPTLPGAGGDAQITWTISSTVDLTWSIPKTDSHGKSVAELLNLWINPSRGMIWRVVVTDGQPVIEIFATGLEARTVGSSTIAAAVATDINLNSDVFNPQPSITFDRRRYEAVYCFGSNPLVSITLDWDRASTISALTTHEWIVTDEPSDEPGSAEVWHAFKLRPSWLGTQYGFTDEGLRHDLGTPAPDGTRAYQVLTPPVTALKLKAQTPFSAGWGTIATGARQPAIVVVGNDTDGYQQLTLTVQVKDNIIWIGSSIQDALLLDALIGTGDRMLVTLGVYEWAPLECAFELPTSDWQRDIPRVLVVRRSKLGQMVALNGTVTGVTDSSGALVTHSGDTLIQDDTGKLTLICAQYAASLTNLTGTLQTGAEGSLSMLLTPGTIIGDVAFNGENRPLGAIIMRRDKTYEPEVRTSWSAERVSMGQESTK